MWRQLIAIAFVVLGTFGLLQLRHLLVTVGRSKRTRFRAYLLQFPDTARGKDQDKTGAEIMVSPAETNDQASSLQVRRKAA